MVAPLLVIPQGPFEVFLDGGKKVDGHVIELAWEDGNRNETLYCTQTWRSKPCLTDGKCKSASSQRIWELVAGCGDCMAVGNNPADGLSWVCAGFDGAVRRAHAAEPAALLAWPGMTRLPKFLITCRQGSFGVAHLECLAGPVSRPVSSRCTSESGAEILGSC